MKDTDYNSRRIPNTRYQWRVVPISVAALALSATLALYTTSQADNSSPDSTGQDIAQWTPPPTLGEALSQLREASRSQTPPAVLKISENQRAALSKSGILTSAKQVGDIAPDFTLSNALGDNVDSKELLKKGPVVLTFYRGGWCPFCNLQLAYMQEALPKIKARGATFVAISPETPDNSLTAVEKLQLEFEVLSDPGSKIAKKYGVAYKMTRELDSLVTVFGLDLRTRQNTEDPWLNLTATYIIDTVKIIKYAFLDVDYTHRAAPAEILATLDDLKHH